MTTGLKVRVALSAESIVLLSEDSGDQLCIQAINSTVPDV